MTQTFQIATLIVAGVTIFGILVSLSLLAQSERQRLLIIPWNMAKKQIIPPREWSALFMDCAWVRDAP